MRKIIPVILLLFFSCANADMRTDNNWEGIRDNILRVAVYQFTADEEDSQKINKLIIDTGRSRAATILVSYASLNIDPLRVNQESDKIINTAVNIVLDNGKIISADYTERGYTLAFIEYDISYLKESLDSISKN